MTENRPVADPFDALKDAPRLLMEARLRPLQGSRFQPTGFPDLGPARYETNNDAGLTKMLLVESPQSVANWLEAMAWEPPQLGRMSSPTAKLAQPLAAMPYVQVNHPDGTPLTNSIIEAHRLNSPYILPDKNAAFYQELRRETGADRDGPLDMRTLARAVFKYDPNSVLHGVMLEEIAGRLRLPRLISGFIEATDVRDASYGGVMNNIIDPKGIEGHGGSSNILYHRTDFTGNLAVFFNFDLALLRGYGLGEDAETFLIAFALFKIERFLKFGLRLRTACDLTVQGEVTVTMPEEGFRPPSSQALTSLLADSLARCRKQFGWAADPLKKLVYEKATKAPKTASTEIELPPDLRLPDGFPEPLASQVELKKARKKVKLVITGPLTQELAEEITKQFPDPGPAEELLRKVMEKTLAEEGEGDGSGA
jgi:CRISPR-associated protein Csb1